MNVDVYWNLHKKCWSVRNRKTGRIAKHAKSLMVEGVAFIVQPAGRARVLQEKKKNVHAFVRGTIYRYGDADSYSVSKIVKYNPYLMSQFSKSDGSNVYDASLVFLRDDGRCYIMKE